MPTSARMNPSCNHHFFKVILRPFYIDVVLDTIKYIYISVYCILYCVLRIVYGILYCVLYIVNYILFSALVYCILLFPRSVGLITILIWHDIYELEKRNFRGSYSCSRPYILERDPVTPYFLCFSQFLFYWTTLHYRRKKICRKLKRWWPFFTQKV